MPLRLRSPNWAFIKLSPFWTMQTKKELDKRIDIISVLTRLGDHRAVPVFIDSLKSKNPEVREWALHAVGVMADSCTYESVLALLDDKDEKVRIKAVWALCAMPDSRSIMAVREIYMQNPTGDLRSIVISALGVLHAYDLVEEFVREYRSLDKDDAFRICYANALANLGDGRAFEIIKDGFLDKKASENNRRFYGVALQKLQDIRDPMRLSMFGKIRRRRNLYEFSLPII